MSQIKLIFNLLLGTSGVKNITYSNNKRSAISPKRSLRNTIPKISIHTTSKASKKPLILVYDINNLSRSSQGLVKGAPFKTKLECAHVLQINRSTVAAYLDTGKLYDNKWIFSSTLLSKDVLSKWVVPSKVWEIVTGELLGDGHLKYDPVNAPLINGRLEFTFSSKILHYVNYLKHDALAFISTESEATPWPNPRLTGKEPTQYWFSTKRLPSITNLHQLWRHSPKQIEGKFIKILPWNIEELLTPVVLAHWIMGDGYLTDGSVKICTDNFTEVEVQKLINILNVKFGIKASSNKRTNPDGRILWRIRISKLSMEKLISLVYPYFIPEMLYKLGVKK